MKQAKRNKCVCRIWGTLLTASAALVVSGCSGAQEIEAPEMGELGLPLTTEGASGVTYRLRDATFAIHNEYYYYYGYGVGGGPSMAGGPNDPSTITVSSEDDPDAQSINVSLEEGSYYIELLPGWHFEKDGPEGPEEVEATLLSGQTQWVWVSRHSTSWAEYQFGLGGRELWLNGKLNISIVLHEDPDELYGSGGKGVGGGPWYGGAAAGGAFGVESVGGAGPAAGGAF